MKKVIKKLMTMIFIFSFVGLASEKTKAGDDGLYASAPPPGSAFVRFINGDMGKPLKGSVRGKESPSVAPGHAGGYMSAPPGQAQIAFGADATTSYDLKPAGHYDAILANGHLTIVDEPINDNKLKTQIVLINASREKDVSLKTADGKLTVIEPAQPEKLGARAVNPVKAAFAIYSGGNKIVDLDERSLERGSDYVIVVYEGAKGPAASYDKSTGT